MQPKIIYERHIIYKPLRAIEETKPNKRFPNKPVKPQTATYRQLIKMLDEDAFGKDDPVLIETGVASPTSWTIRVQEIPEPEVKAFVLRPVSEAVMNSDDLSKLLNPSDYNYVTEFLTEGHRLVHKNIVLSLFRILRISNEQQTVPAESLPSLSSLTPLDASGAFVLEARIRIEDRTKPSLISAATDELGVFRDLMKGSIDMRAPDRLALDTRVR
ncbi:hypothetical protein MBLNU459_g6231t2 [Dothideomycetes sp. NU459]